MKLTNVLDLPDAIVEAVRNDDYDRGRSDITVTQLLSPARQVELLRRHSDEIVEDASDMIWALLGKAVHNILERAETIARVEERLYTQCLGWNVGGQFDRCVLVPAPANGPLGSDTEHTIPANWRMQDYKVMSSWEILNGLKPEREQQLNLLAYLARQNGHRVVELEAVCILRDWSKLEVMRNENYPRKQVARVPVKVWSNADCHNFLMDRISEHQKAQRHELPLCTDEERWSKPDVWAVTKEGRKSALRLLNSEQEAIEWIGSNVKDADRSKITIVHRQGEDTRCLHYCAVAPFCDQHAAKMKEA